MLTDRDVADNLAGHVEELVLDYLAIGVDPARSTIFTHSAVPALNQLMLPFLSLVSVAELSRNPTVKDEIAHSRQAAVSGLMFTYPVHQAADILFCKANLVPVGQDQLPHLELTRTIARRFNDRYGDGGPSSPSPTRCCRARRSLLGTDGTKMSKSRGNAIALAAERRRDRPADPGRQDRLRPAHHLRPGRPPGGVRAWCCWRPCARTATRTQVAADIGAGGAAALKRTVTEAVNEYLAPIRARRAEFAQDRAHLRDVLRAGNAHANALAERTLTQVRTAMHTVY